MKKGIIGIVFCIVMIFSLAVTAQAMDQKAKNTHYGYSLLTDAEKFVYEEIYDGISKMEDMITFTAKIDAGNFKKIYRYYLADSPEHCWLWGDGNEFSYELYVDSTTDKVGKMAIYYNASKTEGPLMKSRMATKIEDLTKDISVSLPDKEKALIVHNRLCEHVAYDDTISMPYIHRAYGALVRNFAVCDGYSYAYQVLLNSLGIRTVTVAGYGTSIISNSIDHGSHAWNLVEFSEGKWSYVDVTWDDHTEDLGIFHYYFGAGNEIIAGTSPLSKTFDESSPEGKSELNNALKHQGGKDHYIVYREKNYSDPNNTQEPYVYNIPFELPTNIVKDGYFDVKEEDKTYLSGYQYKMERKTDSTFFYFLYQGDKTKAADIINEFKVWLGGKASGETKTTNYGKTVELADRGLPTSNNPPIAVVGKEICLMLKYKAHTHTGGTATCYSKKVCEICGVEYGSVLPHNIPDSEHYAYAAPGLETAEEPKYGMMEHWRCTLCHGFFVKDKYGKFVEVREDSLIVHPYTPGDVNDDGAVNNKDVIMLFRYLSGAEVGESFSLGACDPNGDKGFNNKDVVYLFNHISYPSKRETDYALH